MKVLPLRAFLLAARETQGDEEAEMAGKTRGEALARERKALAGVTKELAGLKSLGLAELRARYEALFGETPRSKNLPFLRKKLAWRIQERVEGGLSPVAKARLEALMPAELPGKSVRKKPAPRPKAVAHEGRDLRLPAPGTKLRREHQGETHEVEVLEVGFRFRGKVHGSLSAIARLITGTAWNGFLFFGLIARKASHER